MYNESSRILNSTLLFLTPLLVPGATPLEVMGQAEAAMAGLLGTVYNGKKEGKAVQKGVAFPICLSVNERICNYSPLASEEQVREGRERLWGELVGTIVCQFCAALRMIFMWCRCNFSSPSMIPNDDPLPPPPPSLHPPPHPNQTAPALPRGPRSRARPPRP